MLTALKKAFVLLSMLFLFLAGFSFFDNIRNQSIRAATIPIDDTPVQKSVYLLIFNPVIESAGGVKLTQYKGWNDPDQITNTVIAMFPQMSNNYLSYRIQERQEVDGIYKKVDGFQYTDESYLTCISGTGTCHNPDTIDYPQLFIDYDICSKNVDEVWLWGGPYFGYYEYNPVPYCGKTTFVMGFNYERAIGEALHDFGHRMEYVGINRVGDGDWQQNESNEWNRFSKIDGHCGNIHYPPGTIPGSEEYMYNKSTPVSSDCDGYLSYPTGPFIANQITCDAWGCSQEGYVQWWLNHIPHNAGVTLINGKNLYNNWWKYYAYYDETYEPTPTPVPGVFSNLTSSLPIPGSAVFNFDYSGTSSNYTVDLSTTSDMSSDVYLSFASGASSPLSEPNPTKWDKYTCGATLYWTVRTDSGVRSGIYPETVTCATPTPTPTPTSTPTPTPSSPELLKNPGFELDANGDSRPDNWTSNSKFTRSATGAHGGSYAGRHYSTGDSGYNIDQTVSNLAANTSYSFSSWTNIPTTSDSFTYKLQLIWKNSGGSTLRTDTVKTYSAKTGGWVQSSALKTSPSNTRSVVVRMKISSLKATIYADDFSFKNGR